MNDTYFFGKRMNLNQGGRVNFNQGGPGFYNQADRELYAGGLQFLPQEQYRLGLGTNTGQPNMLDISGSSLPTGIMTQANTSVAPYPYSITGDGGGGPPGPDDDDDDEDTSAKGRFGLGTLASVLGFVTNPIGFIAGKVAKKGYDNYKNPYKNVFGGLNKDTRDAIDRQGRDSAPGRDDAGNPGGTSGSVSSANEGTFCFDPNTLVQMADGSEKKIKEIQLGDNTKGGEVTGVFQFKATDEIHDYKGVTVAGSHYVKEDGKFIMVKDSPISDKIDKIPVVYSLDTTGRRIFINDIEFADYNGDGVAKSFLTNAGVDLTGFDKEVLRQVEHRLI